MKRFRLPGIAGLVILFAAGSSSFAAVNFTWDPATPEIGELVELNVSGVGSVDSAKWEFHEDGCSGFDATYVCTPLYTDCLTTSFKFASSGEKTVTLTVVVNGSTWAPLSRTITVLPTGSCNGGGGCTYSISSTSASFSMEGGTGSFVVTTQAGCAWSVYSNQDWADITSGASGSGTGTVVYTIGENTGANRTATIRAANLDHLVTQAGVASEDFWRLATGEGIGNTNNLSAPALVHFGSKLFATTTNTNDGCEVWQSSDGLVWSLSVGGGFDNPSNTSAPSAEAFDGYLYVGTENEDTGCEVWRTSDGSNWVQTGLSGFGDTGNVSASAITIVGADLYIGTSNPMIGAEVWRSSDGVNWSQVNFDGFGDPVNESATALIEFNGQLYAASTGFWGTRIWRRMIGLTWEQVGLDGFGDNNNCEVPVMVVHEGYLYAGTENSSGAEVWKTSDGDLWTQWNADGFDNEGYNTAVSSMIEFDDSVFSGVYNWSTGAQVWRGDQFRSSAFGFGDQYNIDAPSSAVMNGVLYVGTENPFGLQIWYLDGETVFVSGFESGGTDEWSAVAP